MATRWPWTLIEARRASISRAEPRPLALHNRGGRWDSSPSCSPLQTRRGAGDSAFRPAPRTQYGPRQSPSRNIGTSGSFHESRALTSTLSPTMVYSGSPVAGSIASCLLKPVSVEWKRFKSCSHDLQSAGNGTCCSCKSCAGSHMDGEYPKCTFKNDWPVPLA
jgi:hypothetical protein